MKQWYSHLVEIESIIVELDAMDLSKEQKLNLAHLVDSSLHHTILDAIMSELSNQDKRVLTNYLTENNHDKIWRFLDSRIDGIKDKIKKTADDLILELKKDLKEAKRLR